MSSSGNPPPGPGWGPQGFGGPPQMPMQMALPPGLQGGGGPEMGRGFRKQGFRGRGPESGGTRPPMAAPAPPPPSDGMQMFKTGGMQMGPSIYDQMAQNPIYNAMPPMMQNRLGW